MLMDEIAALAAAQEEASAGQVGEEEKPAGDNGLGDDHEGAASTCPVCYGPPSAIFCCQRCDNMVCGGCLARLTGCPMCRQDFAERPPTRNKFAERLLNVRGS